MRGRPDLCRDQYKGKQDVLSRRGKSLESEQGKLFLETKLMKGKETHEEGRNLLPQLVPFFRKKGRKLKSQQRTLRGEKNRSIPRRARNATAASKLPLHQRGKDREREAPDDSLFFPR